MEHADILVTTADTVEGRMVVRYLGVVFGEHVHSPGWLRGIADDVRHALDDRVEELDTELLSGRTAALRELRRHAAELKATAVVGADFQVQTLRGGVVATLAQGTAVLLDAPVTGGWITPPISGGDHPIVEELRTHGPSTLADLSTRMDVDIDWLDATLVTLEDAGVVTMDTAGRWVPSDEE
ncbi:MAG: heavy metal-binding domain-containing protein [Euzebya sp.]